MANLIFRGESSTFANKTTSMRIFFRFLAILLIGFGIGFRAAAADESAKTEPPDGHAVIRAPARDSEIVITTTSRVGGAIHSLTWNGQEFIDSFDHGRQLQSAANFDCETKFISETFNPTEAGSRRNGKAELVMDVVRWVIKEFSLSLEEFHNDGTSVSVFGAYPRFDSALMTGDHCPEVSLILASINFAVAVKRFLPTARGQSVRFGVDPISARQSFLIETDDDQQLIAPLSSSEGNHPRRVQGVNHIV